MASCDLACFAPSGQLRAAINLGNALLARIDPLSGAPVGVSVDLAQGLARRLGVPLDMQVFDTASQAVEAVTQEHADVGFFAVDPLRGQGIAFTPPYLLIEGSYLVPAQSPLQRVDEVDQSAHRVVVGQGSAYDLFLSRALTQARLVRAPSSAAVVDVCVAQGLEVAAGVRQQLESDARRYPGWRMLPGRFMVIAQAMGCPKGRGEGAAQFLAEYVEAMKSCGFVDQALARHGVTGAVVAPLAELG